MLFGCPLLFRSGSHNCFNKITISSSKKLGIVSLNFVTEIWNAL